MMKLSTSFVFFSAIVLVWIFTAVNVQAQEAGANTGGASIISDENPNNVGETLIDFAAFEENIKASGLYVEKDIAREKNMTDLTDDELDPNTLAPIYKIEYGDFNFDRWIVKFNSSADRSANRRWSYAKKVSLKDGSTVLGVRIHFPKHRYNASARISPPYEIRAYDDNGGVVSRKNAGKKIGVIDNVSTIKQLTIDVSGRNFKYGLSIRLKDSFDNVKEYFMGYVYFANWRRLTWKNTDYIPNVTERDLFRVPIYPREAPYVKFDSLVVYKPGQVQGGDHVIYFKKIDMWFDYAVSPAILADLDIDDESQWGILRYRALKRKDREVRKISERIELIREEERKTGANSRPKDILKLLEKEQTNQPAAQPTQ